MTSKRPTSRILTLTLLLACSLSATLTARQTTEKVTQPKTWRQKARSNGFTLIAPSPCIEASLLELLDLPCNGDTTACKRAFDAIIPPPSKFTPAPYAEHFPRTLLDTEKAVQYHTLKTS